MPHSRPAGPRAPVFAAFALLAALAAPTAAPAATTYRVNLNGSDVSQSDPLHRSAGGPTGASNGTATFTADGFAYPGHVGIRNRVDMTWSSGFSGGCSAESYSDSRTTDFVVTGPAAPSVQGTLHFRLRAGFSRLGGFAGNGGHSSAVFVRCELNGAVVTGTYSTGNGGSSSNGVLAGASGEVIDVPFSMTVNLPVGSPFVADIKVDVTCYAYGNVFNTNPGYVDTDAGNASSPPVNGDGLRLEEVSGGVMDLPAGYTLNSTSWGIVDNHFSSTVAVEPGAPRAELALRVTPNPAAGAVRLELALPSAGEVRADVIDASGRRVRTLAAGAFAAGDHTLRWDGRDAAGAATAAGIYFARVEAAGRVLTRRIARIE